MSNKEIMLDIYAKVKKIDRICPFREYVDSVYLTIGEKQTE